MITLTRAALGVIAVSSLLIVDAGFSTNNLAHSTSVISQIGQSISGQQQDDGFGLSVAITPDGSRIIIGSQKLNDGYAQVFDLDTESGLWNQVGGDLRTGFPEGTQDSKRVDQFGRAVAISDDGSRVAVGAPGATEATDSNIYPFVMVFELIGNTWTQLGDRIDRQPANYNQFGTSVSLNGAGDRLVVGALNPPGAYVYDWNGTAWISSAEITNIDSGDQTGFSVSMSADGNRVAVGSPNAGAGNKGLVRVFEKSGTDWNRLGDPVHGLTDGDRFGSSVSLSSDGNRLGVGAPNNSDNGADSGQVRLFDWDGTEWTPVGSPINGETAGGEFGESVSVSSDGQRVAAGAIRDSGTDALKGRVRVFEFAAGDWFQVGPSIQGEADGDRFGISVALDSTGSTVVAGAFGALSARGTVRVFSVGDLVLPPPEKNADTAPNTTSRNSPKKPSAPGIFLTVPALEGKQAWPMDVVFGAYAVAPSSLYVVRLRSGEANQPATVLGSGWVNARGHLEARILLPRLGPGQHTLTVTAQGAGGETLVLGNQIDVSANGTIRSVTPESLQPTIR